MTMKPDFASRGKSNKQKRKRSRKDKGTSKASRCRRELADRSHRKGWVSLLRKKFFASKKITDGRRFFGGMPKGRNRAIRRVSCATGKAKRVIASFEIGKMGRAGAEGGASPARKGGVGGYTASLLGCSDGGGIEDRVCALDAGENKAQISRTQGADSASIRPC